MRYADGGGLTPMERRRREAVRWEAAGLFAEGVAPVEVARRLRVTSKSAWQWHKAWREGGTAALSSRGPSGQRCKLSPRCQEKLAGYLEEGPAAHGWDQDQVWTGARVATLIGRKFHVSYSVSAATRLMRRLGFTPQIPARRAAERDEQAVASWREATWAQVKPPGRPAAGTSASRTRQDSPAGRRPDERGDGAGSRRS
jgi:transposase